MDSNELPPLAVGYYLIPPASASRIVKQRISNFKQACARNSVKTVVLGENHSPDRERSTWSEVLAKMEKGGLIEIVVPSIYDITRDSNQMRQFLCHAFHHYVKVRSLAKKIDSRKSSVHQIMTIFDRYNF